MRTTDTDRWPDATPVLGVIVRLRDATDVRHLFARASAIALDELPFDRALVLTAAGGRLTADDCGALADDASDRLRRRVLQNPIEIAGRTLEAAALGRPAASTERSVVGEALGEAVVAVAPVAPDGVPLALLVVARDAPALTPAEDAGVTAFAAAVGCALHTHLLARRTDEVSAELRSAMVTVAALLQELREAPLSLPSRRGVSPLTAWPAGASAEKPGAGVLSDREHDIVELLVVGRTNREIADELYLSPDTVKGHVARILRKLGAANRVEVVARYLALAGEERR